MKRLIFSIVVAFVCTVMSAEEQEKKVTESQIPQPVLKAFNETYPGAIVKECAEEIKHNNTLYEISCVFQGRPIDVLYNVDGAVAETEELISADALPDAVKATINKKFKAIINQVEKKYQDGKTFYEVKLTIGDDSYEVLYSDAGKVVEKEKIDGDEE